MKAQGPLQSMGWTFDRCRIRAFPNSTRFPAAVGAPAAVSGLVWALSGDYWRANKRRNVRNIFRSTTRSFVLFLFLSLHPLTANGAREDSGKDEKTDDAQI
jgi:hypothetical protein